MKRSIKGDVSALTVRVPAPKPKMPMVDPVVAHIADAVFTSTVSRSEEAKAFEQRIRPTPPRLPVAHVTDAGYTRVISGESGQIETKVGVLSGSERFAVTAPILEIVESPEGKRVRTTNMQLEVALPAKGEFIPGAGESGPKQVMGDVTIQRGGYRLTLWVPFALLCMLLVVPISASRADQVQNFTAGPNRSWSYSDVGMRDPWLFYTQWPPGTNQTWDGTFPWPGPDSQFVDRLHFLVYLVYFICLFTWYFIWEMLRLVLSPANVVYSMGQGAASDISQVLVETGWSATLSKLALGFYYAFTTITAFWSALWIVVWTIKIPRLFLQFLAKLAGLSLHWVLTKTLGPAYYLLPLEVFVYIYSCLTRTNKVVDVAEVKVDPWLAQGKSTTGPRAESMIRTSTAVQVEKLPPSLVVILANTPGEEKKRHSVGTRVQISNKTYLLITLHQMHELRDMEVVHLMSPLTGKSVSVPWKEVSIHAQSKRMDVSLVRFPEKYWALLGTKTAGLKAQKHVDSTYNIYVYMEGKWFMQTTRLGKLESPSARKHFASTVPSNSGSAFYTQNNKDVTAIHVAGGKIEDGFAKYNYASSIASLIYLSKGPKPETEDFLEQYPEYDHWEDEEMNNWRMTDRDEDWELEDRVYEILPQWTEEERDEMDGGEFRDKTRVIRDVKTYDWESQIQGPSWADDDEFDLDDVKPFYYLDGLSNKETQGNGSRPPKGGQRSNSSVSSAAIKGKKKEKLMPKGMVLSTSVGPESTSASQGSPKSSTSIHESSKPHPALCLDKKEGLLGPLVEPKQSEQLSDCKPPITSAQDQMILNLISELKTLRTELDGLRAQRIEILAKAPEPSKQSSLPQLKEPIQAPVKSESVSSGTGLNVPQPGTLVAAAAPSLSDAERSKLEKLLLKEAAQKAARIRKNARKVEKKKEKSAVSSQSESSGK